MFWGVVTNPNGQCTVLGAPTGLNPPIWPTTPELWVFCTKIISPHCTEIMWSFSCMHRTCPIEGRESGLSNKPVFPQPPCLSLHNTFTAKNLKLTQAEHACSWHPWIATTAMMQWLDRNEFVGGSHEAANLGVDFCIKRIRHLVFSSLANREAISQYNTLSHGPPSSLHTLAKVESNSLSLSCPILASILLWLLSLLD